MILRPALRPALRSPFRSPFERRGGWTPRVLFADGSQGAWYDPSDLSTLFQGSAGASPLTAVGQGIGLLLDKRLGPARGPILLSNTFDSATGWVLGTGWAISGGVMSFSNATGTVASYSFASTAGHRYWIEFDVSGSNPNGSVQINSPGSDSFTFNSVGHKSGLIIPAASRTSLSFTGIGGASFSIDNLTVQELYGNHASQSTTPSRPLLQQPSSYYVARADGVDDNLASTTGGGGTAGFLLCAAITVNGGAGTNRVLWDDEGTNTGYIAQISSLNNLVLGAGNGTSFTSAVSGGTLPVGETHAVMLWDDGTNLNVQIDNNAIVSLGRPVVAAGTAGFTLFKTNGVDGGFAPVDCHQLVYVKDTAKTANERALLKRYVGAKAGIAL